MKWINNAYWIKIFILRFFTKYFFSKKRKNVNQITKIFIFHYFTINFFSIFSKDFFYIKFSKHFQNFYWNRKKSETNQAMKSFICEILLKKRTRFLTLWQKMRMFKRFYENEIKSLRITTHEKEKKYFEKKKNCWKIFLKKKFFTYEKNFRSWSLYLS